MQESPKYAIVNNSFQRVSPGKKPELSMFNLHTNHSFDVQSEVSMASSYGLRSRSIHMPRQEDPVMEDNRLMMRYLMVCVELERMGRLCQKLKIARTSDEQITREFRSEHQLLKTTLHSKIKELLIAHEQVASLQQKVRHFEEALRERDRQLAHKQEQIRSTKLELTGMSLSHSRFQHNEKNRVKELEAELSMERGRYNDLLRRKEETDKELRVIAQRQTALETTASVNQKRLMNLEDEAQNLRSMRAKLEAENQQSLNQTNAYLNEKQQLLLRINEYQIKADRVDELEKRLQERDSELKALARESQSVNGKTQSLQRELAAAQNELRTLRLNESQSLRKHFASLENKLSALGTAAEKDSQMRGSQQLLQVTRERDSLHVKVEQLLSELSKLERTLANRESDCKGCSRLSSENSLLSKKLGVLQQSLRQRESEVLRLSTRSPTANQSKNSGSRVSVKDLLLTAQQLKGSNERMGRLIDSSSEYELRTTTKTTSHRIASRQ